MELMIDSFRGTYRFLSNFYPSLITYVTKHGAWTFTTVEHMFQAMKTTDIVMFERIRTAISPGAAKRLGRDVVLRDGWKEWGREVVMWEALRLKFTKPRLSTALLKTEDALLIEGNVWHDNFWGNCTCRKCINQPGENKLGQMLMQIRKEIRTGKL